MEQATGCVKRLEDETMAETLELPDVLEECIEKFWSDNPDLKRSVLRDWYNGGRVSTDSNMAGLRAVGQWLAQNKDL